MLCRSLTAACTLLVATAVLADTPVNFVYRDAQGNVHDFHFDGGAWQQRQLNRGGRTAAPRALGDPSAFEVAKPSLFSYTALPVGRRDYTYPGEHGDIHHLYHQDGHWRHDTLNNAGVSSAPPVAGRIAGLPYGRSALHYTFRDPEGNLQSVLVQDGVWRAYRLNNGGRTRAPSAAGGERALGRRGAGAGSGCHRGLLPGRAGRSSAPVQRQGAVAPGGGECGRARDHGGSRWPVALLLT